MTESEREWKNECDQNYTPEAWEVEDEYRDYMAEEARRELELERLSEMAWYEEQERRERADKKVMQQVGPAQEQEERDWNEEDLPF